MEPRDRSAWKPTTSTFEGVCLCEWHEEIRKRIPLHFLQVKVVAYQQSVDSGFRSTVKWRRVSGLPAPRRCDTLHTVIMKHRKVQGHISEVLKSQLFIKRLRSAFSEVKSTCLVPERAWHAILPGCLLFDVILYNSTSCAVIGGFPSRYRAVLPHWIGTSKTYTGRSVWMHFAVLTESTAVFVETSMAFYFP